MVAEQFAQLWPAPLVDEDDTPVSQLTVEQQAQRYRAQLADEVDPERRELIRYRLRHVMPSAPAPR